MVTPKKKKGRKGNNNGTLVLELTKRSTCFKTNKRRCQETKRRQSGGGQWYGETFGESRRRGYNMLLEKPARATRTLTRSHSFRGLACRHEGVSGRALKHGGFNVSELAPQSVEYMAHLSPTRECFLWITVHGHSLDVSMDVHNCLLYERRSPNMKRLPYSRPG